MDIKIPSFDLTGKVAIVTGGTRGLGRGIAITLASYGANVVITGRTKESCEMAAAELQKEGLKIVGIASDVSDQANREMLVEKTIENFGRIDILVNNAGIGGKEYPLLDTSMEDWENTFKSDLTSVFALSCLVADRMIKQGRQENSMPYRIINMGSVAGIKSAKYTSAYAPAKAGVIHLTKLMANEWARHGITVNSISPGTIATDMTKDVRADEKNANAVVKMIAMRRFGKVEDIAGSALFLASQASEYITGVNIPVDGGMLLN